MLTPPGRPTLNCDEPLSSRGAFVNSVSAIDKRSISQYEKLAVTLHELDSSVLVQLFHIGVHMRGFYDFDQWTPLWGPSRVPSSRDREIPMEMEKSDIAELVAGHAEAAGNLQLAGIDGVELHGAHSYLLGQFLSPAYNRRSDEYGGTPRRRARVIVEAVHAIRERVGANFVIGVRLSLDEWIGSAGITVADSEEIIDELVSTGGVDLINVSSGGYHSMHMAVAPMGSVVDAYMLPLAERAHAVAGTRAKVMLVGRITTMEVAEQVLGSGAVDLVGMTRALLADPYLVSKAFDGHPEDTVRCVGANFCLSSKPRISCMMNPSTGREQRWGREHDQPVSLHRRKSVVVVGGGPAGMKVAGVASGRGHHVTLFEVKGELGGHIDLLRRLPTRADWSKVIDNLHQPLARSGVEVHTGHEVTADELALLAPDAVLCATGSVWDRNGFSPLRPEREEVPGSAAGHVFDVATATWAVLADPLALGDPVVIYDETGTYLPIGLADLFSAGGVTVTIVSPNSTVGEEVIASGDAVFLYPRLVGRGVHMESEHHLEAIHEGCVEVRYAWSESTRTVPAHSVVMSVLRTPVDALYRSLAGSGGDGVVRDHLGAPSSIIRLGDALAPRTPAAAIYEGEAIGRSL
jgi:2,4-dienoyl-CoA reductase-like NADH-dependent reductase (Old Yellow Enzyme family)